SPQGSGCRPRPACGGGGCWGAPAGSPATARGSTSRRAGRRGGGLAPSSSNRRAGARPRRPPKRARAAPGGAGACCGTVPARPGAYEQFLKQKLTRLEGVASIESSFALEQVKYTNVLPVV